MQPSLLRFGTYVVNTDLFQLPKVHLLGHNRLGMTVLAGLSGNPDIYVH